MFNPTGESPIMHSILIAAAFVAMVLAPCLVALRSGSLPDQELD